MLVPILLKRAKGLLLLHVPDGVTQHRQLSATCVAIVFNISRYCIARWEPQGKEILRAPKEAREFRVMHCPL